MNRPWLIQISPLVMPFDGRQELKAIGHGLTTSEFVAKVWERREAENPAPKRPHRRRWKFPLAVPQSNVTPIRKAKP